MSLTDILDLAGLLLIVACASLAVALFTILGVAGALGTAGVGLLGISWLIDTMRKRGGRR